MTDTARDISGAAAVTTRKALGRSDRVDENCALGGLTPTAEVSESIMVVASRQSPVASRQSPVATLLRPGAARKRLRLAAPMASSVLSV